MPPVKAQDALKQLPGDSRALVIVSGGLDSTIALRLTVARYGAENVEAITFDYGQKQAIEISHAMESCETLSVKHEVVNAGFLREISLGFSANVDPGIAVPNIKQVLGDPQPKTYVPNRNMILLSIAAAYAEVRNLNVIVCGLQVHDLYGYYDTSQRFVDKLNSVLEENRKFKIKILSPFSALSKAQELSILKELDGDVNLAAMTFTCYDPQHGIQCGKCAACAERIMNFARFGEEDPKFYNIDIDWKKLIEKEKLTSVQ